MSHLSIAANELQIIKGALKTYKEKTCIQFVPWTNERDHLYIFKDFGHEYECYQLLASLYMRRCYSLVGRVGGRQELSLGRGCVFHEIIVHELMHTLGFWHEQSRGDRDQYVVIRWENMQPGIM